MDEGRWTALAQASPAFKRTFSALANKERPTQEDALAVVEALGFQASDLFKGQPEPTAAPVEEEPEPEEAPERSPTANLVEGLNHVGYHVMTLMDENVPGTELIVTFHLTQGDDPGIHAVLGYREFEDEDEEGKFITVAQFAADPDALGEAVLRAVAKGQKKLDQDEEDVDYSHLLDRDD